jgi:hypothetical protein
MMRLCMHARRAQAYFDNAAQLLQAAAFANGVPLSFFDHRARLLLFRLTLFGEDQRKVAIRVLRRGRRWRIFAVGNDPLVALFQMQPCRKTAISRCAQTHKQDQGDGRRGHLGAKVEQVGS